MSEFSIPKFDLNWSVEKRKAYFLDRLDREKDERLAAWVEWFDTYYDRMGREDDRVSVGVRFDVLKSDSYKCRLCGASASDGVRLEVDHIVPVSKGGSNSIENLQTLCFDCNRGKAAKDL